jgi:hypothetical protein
MTTSNSSTSTGTATTPPSERDTIGELLHAIEAGAVAGCQAYAPDAELDATVPNWRFSRRGADAILAVYSEWYADAARFESLRRLPIAGGEVVEFVLVWTEHGVPHAAHQVHVLELDDDGAHIVRDTAMCGGRWPAALLAEMEAAGA